MSAKTIGVDLDGVLSDFVGAFNAICHEMYGLDPSIEPSDWDFVNYGLNKKQLDAVWNQIAQTSNFWLKLKRLPDAPIGAMHRLRDTTVYFITSRLKTTGQPVQIQSCEWLREKYYGGVLYPCVITASNKGEIAKALGLTTFIDDCFSNAVSVANHLPSCKVYLKDASHNRSQNDPRIKRIESFDAFTKEVTR